MAEIFDNSGGALNDPPKVVRTEELTDWTKSPGADGFLERALFNDDGTRTSVMMMKIEPGADAPVHSHETREHLYVVDGSFSDGYGTYGPGDYVVRNPNAAHATSSEEGATVLVFMSAP